MAQMFRHSIVVAAGLLASLAPSAVAEPVTLTFAPKPGAAWAISQTRTKSSTQDGKTTALAGTVTATLKVIRETDDGYEMEWTTNSVHTGGLIADGVQPDLLIGVPIRFLTDG